MKYDINHMITHDIDWFCIINGLYVHVASAGGLLPESMRDRDELRLLQYNVSKAPYIFNENEIVYNEIYLNNHSPEGKSREDYVRSFRDMARKGFVSMDRTNWTNPESNEYHVVCLPNRNLKPVSPENGEIKIPALIQDEALNIDAETVGVKLFDLFNNN